MLARVYTQVLYTSLFETFICVLKVSNVRVLHCVFQNRGSNLELKWKSGYMGVIYPKNIKDIFEFSDSEGI